MKNYGSEMPEKSGQYLCKKCKTYFPIRGGAKKQVCPWCSEPREMPKVKVQPVIGEGQKGSTANNPIPLWDRGDIMKALEKGFGESFFINGEQVIKTNEGKEVKLIQIKTEDGEYKNIYFGL